MKKIIEISDLNSDSILFLRQQAIGHLQVNTDLWNKCDKSFKYLVKSKNYHYAVTYKNIISRYRMMVCDLIERDIQVIIHKHPVMTIFFIFPDSNTAKIALQESLIVHIMES
jgi:hypothetical protein